MPEIPQPALPTSTPLDQQPASAFPYHGITADDLALALVVQDANRAESWLQSKLWVQSWDAAQLLYEAVVPPDQIRMWPGTKKPRAHLQIPLLFQVLESLQPQIVDGLFAAEPPFSFEPRPGTQADVARAAARIVEYQLDDLDVREEYRKGVKSLLLFGSAFWKWGWETYQRTRKIWRRKEQVATVQVAGTVQTIPSDSPDDFELAEELVNISRPTFEHVNIRHLLVDPTLAEPDIRKAKFVIHRMYLSANQLDDLRNQDGYEIPDRETLRGYFFPAAETALPSAMELSGAAVNGPISPLPRFEKATSDPMEQPLEVLEYWTADKCVVVVQKKLVIKNQTNEFGRIPFFSATFADIPNNGVYGLGLGRLIGVEQQLVSAITNMRLDEVALNLYGLYKGKRGSGMMPESVPVAPGHVIKMDDPSKDLLAVERQPVLNEAYQEVAIASARAEATSGANQLTVQGQLPQPGGRSSITRTATGASILGNAAGARLQALVDQIAQQAFEPMLYAFAEMNSLRLPPNEMRRLLNDELQQAYSGDMLDVMNARVKFSCLAASNLQARRALAQALPIMAEFLLQGPIPQMLSQQAKKIDVGEFVNLLFDVTGYKDEQSLIVAMTADDEQRAIAMSQTGQQALLQQQKHQHKQQQLAQQHAQNVDKTQEEGAADMTKTIASQALQQAEDKLLWQQEKQVLQSGEPGSAPGFGSQE